jgi:hypothetical protein
MSPVRHKWPIEPISSVGYSVLVEQSRFSPGMKESSGRLRIDNHLFPASSIANVIAKWKTDPVVVEG